MIAFSAQDVFLVTGASSGLGAASALLLNALGATVIANGRDCGRLQTLRGQSEQPANLHCAPKDLVADIDTLGPWMQTLKNRHGKLRGLLHCAGAVSIVPARMQKADAMRDLFEINVQAAYQTARAFLDRRNNIGRGASLVFLASAGALRDNTGISAYAASKGAIISLMRALACEFKSQGIRVNALSPAIVPTPMTRALYAGLDEISKTYPLGPGTPEDVARAAAFFLSPQSGWISGQNLVLDGGHGL